MLARGLRPTKERELCCASRVLKKEVGVTGAIPVLAQRAA